jgi:O-antigen biosynthesis protein
MRRVCIGIHFSSGFRLLERTVAGLRANTSPQVGLMILADVAEASSLLQLRNLRNIPQLLSDGAKGSAAAFNLLVRASDADSLVFLTTGTLLAPGWLETMLGLLQEDSRTGIVLDATGLPDGQRPSCGGPPVFLALRRVALALGPVDQKSGPLVTWISDYCARASESGFAVARAFVTPQHLHLDPPVRENAFSATAAPWAARPWPPAQIRPARPSFGTVAPHAGKTVERLPVPDARLVRFAPSIVSSETLPLVSCIMPTRDRPAYVRQSIQYFERQNYPERELIILDDGLQPLAGEVPIHPRIRYVRRAPGQSVGAKRNQGCELARGTIIAHWDDDDWYGPDRLRAQVEPLLQNEAEITALRETTFFYVDRWEFWRCSPQEHQRLFVGDVHGGTLVFFRHIWERLAHYPCVSLAEDAGFLRQALKGGARLLGLSSQNLFLYLRHATNTWSLHANLFRNSSRWQRSAEPDLPPDDRAFYEKRSIATREACA